MIKQYLSVILLILINNQFSRIDALNDIKSNEYELHKTLFENYLPAIRPVKNWSDPLNVKISISLIKVADVVEDFQNIVLQVRLTISWTDNYLAWNSSVSDIKSVIIPASSVWTPDLHLFNSASVDDHLDPKNVELYSNGTVVTFPLTHLNSHCDFDFTRFPYDSQKCSFVIGTMTDITKVRLNLNTNVDSRLFPNPEWKFIGSETSEEILLTYPGTDRWSTVKFTVEIKRNSIFYVNLFIWPLIFILFIIMSIFILPPIVVERVVMGVMILLSLILMLLILESYTPRNSFNSWPIIGKLILFDMFMATISTLVATLIIGINRDSFIVRPVPQWLKRVSIKWLAKIACKQETVYAHFVANQDQRGGDDIEVIDTNQINSQQPSQQTNENGLVSTVAPPATVTNDLIQIQALIVLINNQLAMFRMRLKEKDIKEQHKKDWFLIASILDRICLLFYSFTMFLGLIIVFA